MAEDHWLAQLVLVMTKAKNLSASEQENPLDHDLNGYDKHTPIEFPDATHGGLLKQSDTKQNVTSASTVARTSPRTALQAVCAAAEIRYSYSALPIQHQQQQRKRHVVANAAHEAETSHRSSARRLCFAP